MSVEAPVAFVRRREPKPEWLKVRAPGSPNYVRLKQHDARPPPEHGVRGGPLPQHRRVLAPRHRDVHDSRRRVHAGVRLLRGGARPAGRARYGRAGARRRRRGRHGACATSSSPRWTATTSPDGGASMFAETIREIRARRADVPHRGAHPRFPGRRRRRSRRCSTPARRAEPQHRDGAAPVPHGAPRRPLQPARSNCSIGRGTMRPHIPTKSGLMVGLGEEWDEVVAPSPISRGVGCEILTIGQYLSPSAAHLPDRPLLPPGRIRDAQVDRARHGIRPRGIRPARPAARTTRTSRPTRSTAPKDDSSPAPGAGDDGHPA